jgi:DHA2 family methylenomycin A resistance protein-like MFS transporter
MASCVFAVISAGEHALPAAAAGGGACALAVIAFGLAERRAATPLLPLGLLRSARFRFATGASLVLNLTANGSLFVVTRYLQSVHGYGARTAGIMLLPLFVPLAVLSPLAGGLTARSGPRVPLLAGAAFMGAGELALTMARPSAGYPLLLPALAGLGIGVGFFTAPIVATAMRAVPAGQAGLAGGINNTARQAGTALGVAIFGAVAGNPALAAHYTTAMGALGVAAALAWGAIAVRLLAGNCVTNR